MSKIYDVADWTINNYNTYIDQYLKNFAQYLHQTMKFVQLIEYKMRNVFLGKPCTKCGGEASHRTLCKKSKLSISLDQQSEML